ncbi:hypothetical protein [Chromobacterium sphagni]|uniref:ATP-grasp domain-containing protein n=1 Tax=Chromobacterium sphagni TaxID=1903179 RepID=A0A1S1X582_9NEIS|nr:hypothetical protein [Chromobacterium sphagni]OHX14622.1 hypothetical protein BI347_14735 [Chromobacterium sphagni]OHX20710.1 hypothetical protein BI344_14420 [Chromobacterium sphagni]
MPATSGQVAFDFIKTANGSCDVLECNPRATSAFHLFHNLPQQLAAALLGDIPPGETLRPSTGLSAMKPASAGRLMR